FDKLLSGVREQWKIQIQNFQSEVSAAISSEKATCEKLRKDIERVEADRAAFNSQPDVIESRRQLGEVNQQTEKLQGDVDRARGLEAKLLSICERKGIDPHAEPESVPAPGPAVWEGYQKVRKDERAGKAPAGAAIAYWRTHEAELRAYADSV